MAKYGPSSVLVSLDGTPGGSPVDMTQHVLTINGVDVESIMEESHSFGDTWFEALSTGIRKMADVVVGGFYDDTATTGPNAVFVPVATVAEATRTLLITYGGTKTTGCECYVVKYTRSLVRNQLHRYEATLRPTGTVTEA